MSFFDSRFNLLINNFSKQHFKCSITINLGHEVIINIVRTNIKSMNGNERSVKWDVGKTRARLPRA